MTEYDLLWRYELCGIFFLGMGVMGVLIMSYLLYRRWRKREEERRDNWACEVAKATSVGRPRSPDEEVLPPENLNNNADDEQDEPVIVHRIHRIHRVQPNDHNYIDHSDSSLGYSSRSTSSSSSQHWDVGMRHIEESDN